jgi:hypothetical protein
VLELPYLLVGGRVMGWAENPQHKFTPNCKVMILRPLPEVYSEYQPELGKVYEAEFCKAQKRVAEFAVIEVKDKRIIVRHDEFVLLELNNVER